MIDLSVNNGYTKDIQRGFEMKIKSKIFSLGNSNAVRIPKNIMKSISLKPDDDITIEVGNDELIIRKAMPSTVSELFQNYKGKYTVEEICDKAVGEEIL